MEYCNYLFSNIHKLHQDKPVDFPVQILGAGYEKIDYPSYYWDEKSLREDKDFLILQYTLEGKGHFEFTRHGKVQKHILEKDSLFMVFSDTQHKYWYDTADPPWIFYWVTLTGPYLKDIVRTIRKSGSVHQIKADSPAIQLLSGFLGKLSNRFYIDTYSLSTFAYEFLTQVYKHLSRRATDAKGASPYDFIYQVQSFIRHNLSKIDLDLLAEHFGYNKIYFNSYFKKKTGTTPHQYILTYKIKYAAFLLCATQRKIRVVARESGFENENYFSKVFKKHMGSTPEKYRLENKASYSSEEYIIL
jgi:AraC-like DNA-binding protein